MVFAVVLVLVLVQHFCCVRQGVGWCAALGAVGFYGAKRLHVKVEARNGFCRGTCTVFALVLALENLTDF